MTQTVMTRPGPKTRTERMHDHVNRLRTGPCSRDRHWYVPVGGDMRCERCDEEAPRFEKRRERCRVTPFGSTILGIDPATPDQPPIVVTLVDGDPIQIERGHPPTPWVEPDIAPCRHSLFWWAGGVCMVCGPRKPRPYLKPALDAARPRIAEAFRSAVADGRLFPYPDDLEPIGLMTWPLRDTLRRSRPHIDIHPNGGIPG